MSEDTEEIIVIKDEILVIDSEGAVSNTSSPILERLALMFKEREASATEDELAAEEPSWLENIRIQKAIKPDNIDL